MYLKSINELRDYVNTLSLDPSEQLMIMVADNSSDHVNELIEYLNSRNIKFFGGIYAGLLVEKSMFSVGFILEKFQPVYTSLVLPYMMRFKLDPASLSGSTTLVLIDGLSGQMKELTDTIQDKLGSTTKYIGGGAGFYNLEHKPCIFDNKGLYIDAAYICIVDSDIKLGVKHGWNKLEGPFAITEARGNTLSKLDDFDAFDVYKDVVEEAERITLCKEDFFVYAKEHPFGISQDGQPYVVRDPIGLNEDNAIICVADIPEGADAFILQGNIDSLLSSSLQIAEECAAGTTGKYLPLLFDCISRAMFMEGRFAEELTNIQNQLSFPVLGALSIGEIASQRDGKLIIHNKSSVLGLLETK